MKTSTTNILLCDLAVAEAVLNEEALGKKKLHGPTVDIFRGQALACKRALSLLEMEAITPVVSFEINRTYTVNIPGMVLALVSLCGILLLWHK